MINQMTWATLLALAAAPGTNDPGEAAHGHPLAGSVEAAAPADTVPEHRDPEIIRTENFTMSLGSRVQVRYSHLDSEPGSSNGSFAIRRARFSLGGSAYERFRYAVQLDLSGGSTNLIDAKIRTELHPLVTLWVGQGKAPFGRQQLTSAGDLNFVDRTLVDGRFSIGRDVGASLLGQNEGQTFEYAVGVYNGNGINTANNNNRYMYVGRAVWTPLGAYAPVESAFDYPESARVALGASAYRTTTGVSPSATEVRGLNVEGAFKIDGFNATGELYREEADPEVGPALETTGWYAQVGYLLPSQRHEIAVRYGVVSPDLPVDVDVVETGVALSHYLSQHRAKVQADLRHVEFRATDSRNLELRLQLQLTL